MRSGNKQESIGPYIRVLINYTRRKKKRGGKEEGEEDEEKKDDGVTTLLLLNLKEFTVRKLKQLN